jgi:hypothetical protein
MRSAKFASPRRDQQNAGPEIRVALDDLAGELKAAHHVCVCSVICWPSLEGWLASDKIVACGACLPWCAGVRCGKESEPVGDAWRPA